MMDIMEIMALTEALKAQAREDIRKENEDMIAMGITDDPQLSFFDDEDENEDNDEEAIFNTPQKKRCRDCSYLVEGDNGEWICDDCGKDIHDIPDDECSANEFPIDDNNEPPKEGYYRVNTFFGSYDVITYRSTYWNNNNLAIQLFTDEEPFATLTVNLDKLNDPALAYVDTNNCPWAEEFIRENELGEPVGAYKGSGYCIYPLYKFDLSKL